MFSIVVPIKNQFKIIKMCLESVEQHYASQEVVIIDDGSDEIGTRNFLNLITQTNDNWKLIRNDKSVGHTKACEQGIENTKSENIFLLNSDTIVTKNSLNALSEVLDNNNDIAVVGPKTSSASGLQLSLEAQANKFKWTIDEIEKFAEENEKIKDNFHDIELCNGFCFGIKRKIFFQVGKFDPVLTCYGNEKELSIRIRNAGFRTVYVPTSYVHHFGKMTYSHENINIGRAQIDADRYINKKFGKLG